MKLDFESIGASLKPYRVYIIIAALLIVLGGLFWFFGAVDRFFWNWGVDRDKAAIQEQLANIKTKEATIANLQIEVAVEKEQVVEAIKDHVNAMNATDATKAETNRHLANLANAKNANQTNVTVDQLTKNLDELDK